MTDAVLTLNAGSSSIKFALFEIAGAPRRIVHGEIEGIGTAPHWRARDLHGAILIEKSWPGGTHEDFLDQLLGWTEDHLGSDHLAAAGHRIVHGGADFTAPVKLDPATIAALDRLSPLAPLHQPHNLEAVRAVAKLRPGLLQIGCFDTAFHATMDATARRFALPRALEESGVRRYGFHWAMAPAFALLAMAAAGTRRWDSPPWTG
jgi:acetate kinase